MWADFLSLIFCLQDFTGVPAVVDLAAMRDAMKNLSSDPNKINPLVCCRFFVPDLSLYMRIIAQWIHLADKIAPFTYLTTIGI